MFLIEPLLIPIFADRQSPVFVEIPTIIRIVRSEIEQSLKKSHGRVNGRKEKETKEGGGMVEKMVVVRRRVEKSVEFRKTALVIVAYPRR